MIDKDFHQLVSERLSNVSHHLKDSPDLVADRMLRGRFERIKCSYGTPASSAFPMIPIEIPDYESACWAPEAHIEDGRLLITMEELKDLFDIQVERMLSVIDEQLARMQRNHPGIQIVE